MDSLPEAVRSCHEKCFKANPMCTGLYTCDGKCKELFE